MKRHTTAAALFSLLLAAGCSDRADKNAQQPGEEAATAPASPAAAEPAGAAPAPASQSAAPPKDDRREGSRATAGSGNRGADTGRAASGARATSPSAAPPTPETAAAPKPEWREVTIPEGTALPLELETALSSETAQVETPVRARLKQAVLVNGVTALPAGAILSGEVTSVARAGRVKGRAALTFTFNQVRAENVTSRVSTAPLSYAGEATRGEDATKIGAGAVGGAIVGGIIGGGDGAAKGAAIGGAAGTGVVLATRGKEVELAAGSDLAATLAAPLTVRVANR